MKRQSIILLTIDALRADHLGYHGYDRETSPFLDSLSERTTSFINAVSASSHTREAVPALLTGEYPDLFGANGYRCVSDTIADRLSTLGYRTAGFHSNPYISRAYGFDSGFDTFDDDLRLGQNRYVALFQRALDKFLLNRGQYHARAETINQRSLEWLDSIGNEPFFLWNHYMDPHGPYNPPQGHTFGDRDVSNSEAHDLYQKIINHPENITGNERRLLVDCYDGEIRYLDNQLKQFFDELENRELIRDSLVIVTADHGEAFGEHGYYTHPRYLHEYLLHVPLLISEPGNTNEETIASSVSTLDVVPTILSVANASTEGLPGASLLNRGDRSEQRANDIIFASATGEDECEGVRRFAARGPRRMVLIERDIDSGDILDERTYDLQTGQEETERRETIDAEHLLAELRTFSASRLASVDDTPEENTTREGPPELEERLEDLGYK